MILSHRHRFIFFAVPKTGTHAVRFALREHLGETDEEQVQLFVRKTLSYPEIAQLQHGHIRWDEIRPVLGDEVWNGYFKFAFVRNPWDRFVSYCAFAHRNTGGFARDPRSAMHGVIDDPNHRRHLLFQPQHRFICNADGTIMVDYVGRHETMQASYDAIADRIGLPRQNLQVKNASTHGPWRDYYDDALKRRVAELYERDIELFGYSF
jgi:hypothetical protein